MTMTRGLFVFGALVAAAFNFAVPEARAQYRSSSHVPNSYEDFPNNQGSLFYQYRGPGSAKKTRTTPRRSFFQGNAATQRVVPNPTAPQSYYYLPQQGVRQQYYYASPVQGGYVPQAPVYYYYPSGYGTR